MDVRRSGMDNIYSATRDYSLSPSILLGKLQLLLPQYATILDKDSDATVIDAQALPSDLVPCEFAFRAEVQTFDNHFSRVTLTCLSPTFNKQESLAAHRLFPAIFMNLKNGGVHPGTLNVDGMLHSRPHLPLTVGIGGIVGLIIGQLLESHYSAYNFLCTGYTPGSGTGCGAYTAYYDIGIFLFILGIVAVVVAVGLTIVSKRHNTATVATSPFHNPTIAPDLLEDPDTPED